MSATEPAPGARSVADGLVEGAGRWAAARSTRRSFIGRLGRVAMLVAGGPVIASLLADEASARVCGQSGVSVLCPTFDCDDVWGWCWYATGCCAGGGLKKICDCCAVDWPNVHGYCPSGTNVKCIVESCGTDPRVQTAVLTRIRSDDPLAVAVRVSRLRYPNGSPVAVLADADDPLHWAVAVPAAAALGGPVLPVRRGRLPAAALDELARLHARRVVVVGPRLPGVVAASLEERGHTVRAVGRAPDAQPLSVEVAEHVRAVTGVGAGVVVEPVGRSLESLPVATAFAASRGLPLLVGAGAARAAQLPAWFVGPEAVASAGALPAVGRVDGPSVHHISVALAEAAYSRTVADPGHVALGPLGSPALLAAAGAGSPLVLHPPGALDGTREWLHRHRDRYGLPRTAVLAGEAGTLPDPAYKELQSILNGFETQLLIGVAGQGLPVIDQPLDERPVGRARIASTGDAPEAGGTYWTSRGGEL